MAKYHGASDAFNAILQKVDETLIQAEAHLRHLNDEAIEEKTVKSVAEQSSMVPSPPAVNSERSCSPNLSSPRVSISISAPSIEQKVQVKHKSYMALDKKKAIVVTSIKSEKKKIDEAEVAKVQMIIEKLFKGGASSASSSSSSAIHYCSM